MNLDERLEQIRCNIHRDLHKLEPPKLCPLPIRSKGLENRVEFVLNMFVAEKMDIKKVRLPTDWIAVHHVSAAVALRVLPLCERAELRIKRIARRLGEWLFRMST